MQTNLFLNKFPKSKAYAFLGTIISLIIILLILLLVVLPQLEREEDGGIMISFGDSFEGGGTDELTNQVAEQASPPVKEIKEDIITQEEESAFIPDTKKQEEEKARLEAERLQKEQQLAQQADEMMGGLFGAANTAGSGQSSGDTPAGNPAGKGSMDGNSWSLDGRDLLGTMPRPQYTKNAEGYLTIEIRVNEAGNVVSARVQKGTISDPSIRDAAINAAKRTKFSTGKSVSVGTITYNFKLK